ncbi:MAG TPA: peptidoglycan DD-metalloendopeptidase family protein [Phnomibacter sp.]|nr:peptidoglycan DD-metalloendopeptidase family protein [Phnomibacter sp.]
MHYTNTLAEWIARHGTQFSKLVPFDEGTDSVVPLDFTAANTQLSPEIVADTSLFSAYIQQQLAGARYGIGGYNEHRTVYSRSSHFDTANGGEPRRLHLGVDIWCAEGTPVSAPVSGLVHSFAFNNNHGDYGATIILSHQLDGRSFYTLYGHLSIADLENVREGNYLVGGEVFAHVGPPSDNGNWPPHLHFQVIENIGTYIGDYPGVCRYSERASYLSNCPDPGLILHPATFSVPNIGGL